MFHIKLDRRQEIIQIRTQKEMSREKEREERRIEREGQGGSKCLLANLE